MKNTFRNLLAAFAVVALSACGGEALVESDTVVGADETGELSSELSTAVPVGSVLATTSGLNLRTGAGTGYRVIMTMPQGARVTTINRSTPVRGWYNIKYGTRTGWAYGSYLRLVSKPGGDDNTPTRRDKAISRAISGKGYSYWWGHGAWGCGRSKGSCSGGCPGCKHYGNGGADCSGFAAKVWQVPSSNTSTCTDSHPYSTYNFRYERHYWHVVARSNLRKADALVYNANGSGHITIYRSGNGWGSMYMYEAKGCAYGIVYNLRPLSSAYIGIGRNGY